MTDDLERRLRTWMHADGDVPPAAVSRLAASVSALPARDRGPSPALALAAVLALIVALGVVALRPGGGLLGGVASPDPGAAVGPQPTGTPGSTATPSATIAPTPADASFSTPSSTSSSPIPTPTATKASAPIATLSSPRAPAATSGAADPLLTCGGRSFPVTALDAPTGAEHAVGPEYDALRATLARDESEFPLFSGVPWQLASRDADGAIFLARRDPIGPPGWVSVEVVADANGWQPLTMQECELFMVPSAGYGPATWVLDQAFPAPTPDSTELHILVLERRCSSGSLATGRMSDPLVGYTAESVTVTIGVRPLAGDQDCIGFPGTPALVRLTEPLGDRTLLDGGRFPPTPPPTPLSGTTHHFCAALASIAPSYFAIPTYPSGDDHGLPDRRERLLGIQV